jgi:hypothetical protein
MDPTRDQAILQAGPDWDARTIEMSKRKFQKQDALALE